LLIASEQLTGAAGLQDLPVRLRRADRAPEDAAAVGAEGGANLGVGRIDDAGQQRDGRSGRQESGQDDHGEGGRRHGESSPVSAADHSRDSSCAKCKDVLVLSSTWLILFVRSGMNGDS
jgi:hypothetical protein